MKSILENTVNKYLSIYETEAVSLQGLRALIAAGEHADPTAPNNFEGHVTGSMFVVTLESKVLLLENKRIGKYVQSGGHIDTADASPFITALRELEEETEISKSVLSHQHVVPADEIVPFHIDVQRIPASKSGNEPAHLHYDFQYLATVREEAKVRIDQSESNDWTWVDWQSFQHMPLFEKQVAKMGALLAQHDLST